MIRFVSGCDSRILSISLFIMLLIVWLCWVLGVIDVVIGISIWIMFDVVLVMSVVSRNMVFDCVNVGSVSVVV